MPDYRRAWHPGGTYFFTVNLLQRHDNDLLIRHIDELRESVRWVKRRHTFVIHAWVILLEHLHCVMELPPNDADFSVRWRLIKLGFSRSIPPKERRSKVRKKRGERRIWQRRYWEHLIRVETDYRAQLDTVHFNPVKHGWVSRVSDWPYSTFHRLIEQGVYPPDWAGGNEILLAYDD